METNKSRTVALRDRDPEDQTTFDFNDLPIRIIELIFEYLETYEIVRMRRVSPAFKDYVDGLPKKESSIRPFETIIRGNSFTFSRNDLSPTFRTLEYFYSPPKNYRIYEDVQLNWIRPYSVTYESSNVLESSSKFQEFLKDVRRFEVWRIKKEGKCLENFCKNMEFIENLQEFICFDKTLKEKELAKIISSLKTKSNHFDLTLHQNLPFLTKPIIDSFLKISYGKVTILKIGSQDPRRNRFEGPEEMWRDGIFRFFDYKYEETEEGGDICKTLEFSNCERSTGEAIISLLHKKFNYQSIVRKTQIYGKLRFGNRTVKWKYI